MKTMITCNEKVLTNVGLLHVELPPKGQEAVTDLQHNQLTSLVHFALKLHKVD